MAASPKNITLLMGPDTFSAQRALAGLISEYTTAHPGIEPERVDGSLLEPRDLPDLLQGASLFSEDRLIVMKDPSAHKAVWTALEDYAGKVSDSTRLIIVDAAVDKRTKTYKSLQKIADVRDFPERGPRDANSIVAWLIEEGKSRGVEVPRDSARLLIDRAGYDGWTLSNALDKLAIVSDASPASVRDLVEPSPSASAFEVFEDAVSGRRDKVRETLTDLRASQDPHALVGLLAGQAFQLALVANSTKSPAELAKLVGGHPYPLQKMQAITRSMSRARVMAVIAAVAECDRDLKHSVAEPWVLIERALVKVAAAK